MAHTSKRVPSKTMDELEAMIDRHSLEAIASTIAEICFAKAEHVSSAWQDEPLARAWDRAGAAFDRFSGNRAIQNLP